MSEQLGIGMLSGTSRDGVDAVLVNFAHGAMDLLHAKCTPYPAAIARTLDQLIESGQPPTSDMASLLDEQLGKFFARVAQDLVRESGLQGARGQVTKEYFTRREEAEQMLIRRRDMQLKRGYRVVYREGILKEAE